MLRKKDYSTAESNLVLKYFGLFIDHSRALLS